VVSRIRQLFGIELGLRQLFAAPSVAKLAAIVEEAKRDGNICAVRPLVRADRHGHLPLSFGQERLWRINQLQTGNPAYSLSMMVRLSGVLDTEKLEWSLRKVVQRHEALRTHFEMCDGHPVQVIEPQWKGSLERIDLRGLDKAQQEKETTRRATQETLRSFDLNHGPLLRACVLEWGEDQHVLVLTMHQIATDAWSMEVLARELATIYDAFSKGHEPAVPELPIQYADYSVWQREWLQGEVLVAQLAYWQKQLAGIPRLELASDRLRSAPPSRDGATVPVNLPAGLVRRLRELSREEGVTLFMVLLAAFQLVLSRHTGQEDVAVGTEVANRTRAELEDLIGHFVNEVVLRTDLSGNPSLRVLLERVRNVCLEAYAHQDLPFALLVEELSPGQQVDRIRLFQVKLVLHNVPVGMQPVDVTMSPMVVPERDAKFDLLLNLREAGDSLVGECVYPADLFETATVECLTMNWERVLEAMSGNPERRISDLELTVPALHIKTE